MLEALLSATLTSFVKTLTKVNFSSSTNTDIEGSVHLTPS